MIATWKAIIWRQFGASIDMLENAIRACPEDIWSDRARMPEYWYVTYHTLFWLDCYLADSPEKFSPPAPFTLSEMDPAGLLPERVYTKEEMLTYLEHGRKKCKSVIDALTEEKAVQRYVFGNVDLSVAEMYLHVMRHVQHHAAQLNLILRQTTDSTPRWVFKAKE